VTRVSGNAGARVEPLRHGDPDRLGQYELQGRLGQGGMGVVYLARDAAGHPVAVKVIRADLAADGEFRQRFRSEVSRAREVPPFCTAEVLDADPDHRFPYLVVEYVDGPSLADVVAEQGPLSAAHLHALAIGVATALTAIHGAGVVHRDLKPRNVLLAPVSPKVIDFGIARAMDATSHLTRTSQLLGTVAYMAPERFDPDAGRPVGPASDIFAWGAVIAYAGTGRTPFHADSPPATAARILTQPPDLAGLPPQLHDLVALTLAKEPDERPSARELLDMLLGSGPQAATARAALAEQPGLQAAARSARAGRHSAAGRAARATAAEAPPGRRGRRRWPIVAGAAAAVAAVAAVAVLMLGSGLEPAAAPDPGEPSAGASGVSAAPPVAGRVIMQDPLVKKGLFETGSSPEGGCTFRDSAYAVDLKLEGFYTCDGPVQEIAGDHLISVDVTLTRPGSCSSIFFLRSSEDDYYELESCADVVILNRHDAEDVDTVGSLALAQDLTTGREIAVGLRVAGTTVTAEHAGRAVATFTIPAAAVTTGGRMTLGVYGDDDEAAPPYGVRYRNIEVRRLR
jgi:predicted Ser/Thr protein kinase